MKWPTEQAYRAAKGRDLPARERRAVLMLSGRTGGYELERDSCWTEQAARANVGRNVRFSEALRLTAAKRSFDAEREGRLAVQRIAFNLQLRRSPWSLTLLGGFYYVAAFGLQAWLKLGRTGEKQKEEGSP